MPFGINSRNLIIILLMAVVGFYTTAYLVSRYGGGK